MPGSARVKGHGVTVSLFRKRIWGRAFSGWVSSWCWSRGFHVCLSREAGPTSRAITELTFQVHSRKFLRGKKVNTKKKKVLFLSFFSFFPTSHPYLFPLSRRRASSLLGQPHPTWTWRSWVKVPMLRFTRGLAGEWLIAGETLEMRIPPPGLTLESQVTHSRSSGSVQDTMATRERHDDLNNLARKANFSCPN